MFKSLICLCTESLPHCVGVSWPEVTCSSLGAVAQRPRCYIALGYYYHPFALCWLFGALCWFLVAVVIAVVWFGDPWWSAALCCVCACVNPLDDACGGMGSVSCDSVHSNLWRQSLCACSSGAGHSGWCSRCCFKPDSPHLWWCCRLIWFSLYYITWIIYYIIYLNNILSLFVCCISGLWPVVIWFKIKLRTNTSHDIVCFLVSLFGGLNNEKSEQ